VLKNKSQAKNRKVKESAKSRTMKANQTQRETSPFNHEAKQFHSILNQ
jgi:hypothetical protein